MHDLTLFLQEMNQSKATLIIHDEQVVMIKSYEEHTFRLKVTLLLQQSALQNNNNNKLKKKYKLD